MGEFRMPSLGADMQAGTLLLWKVKPGDTVRRGDIVAEVSTDKGDIEVEIFESGVVEALLVEPGQKVPVGTILATIGTAAALAKPAARVRASPLARKLAIEHGLDLERIEGTGAGGAIRREDVEHAAAALRAAPATERPPALPTPAAREPATASTVPAPSPAVQSAATSGMRRAIAAAMARANREIPHYYVATRVDMSRALAWLEVENRKRGMKDRLLPAVLSLKAMAAALRELPELNAYYVDDTLQPQRAIHIGLAIALRGGGIVTPALHDVDRKGLDELMQAMSDLIGRARAGRLRSSELADATITLTQLGDLGVETVFGVIYPPQVALVGLGKVLEQPWAENGMLGVRPVLQATLAGDHRASDGRRGAQFLDAFARLLQDPAGL